MSIEEERLRSTVAQLTADRDSWKALAGDLVEQRDKLQRENERLLAALYNVADRIRRERLGS